MSLFDLAPPPMTSIYALKPRFQALLRPWLRALVAVGVTANQVTVAALLLSLIYGAWLANAERQHWPLLFMPLALFLRMALNAIDGMLAREHGMKSSLGAILNELGDVLSDATLYLPLALVPGIAGVWIVIVVLLAIVSEMTGVVAVQIGATRRYDGPMGKSDRAFVFGLFCLLLGLGILSPHWFNYAMIVTALLSLVTIFNRARRSLREAV